MTIAAQEVLELLGTTRNASFKKVNKVLRVRIDEHRVQYGAAFKQSVPYCQDILVLFHFDDFRSIFCLGYKLYFACHLGRTAL